MNEPSSDEMQQAYVQAVQAGQQQDPASLYADSMREAKVNNILQQLNPDNLVEDIEHRIRGEKKDRFTDEWVPISKGGKQKISEELISRYISFLSSFLNQNTSVSNYSAKQINNIMGMIIDYLTDDLSDNAEEYGFVTKNEIEVNVIVKQLIRKAMPDGKIGIIYIDKPTIQKRTTEEVVDFNEMTRIGMIVCGTTFSVLSRALNGSEARRLWQALKVSESLNPQQQKKGFWEAMKFWQ